MKSLRLIAQMVTYQVWGTAIFMFGSCFAGGVYTVTNTHDFGAQSLRQAILDSNANFPGPNRIEFNIPGTGPFVIMPSVDLPDITVPVQIDGYTQPGSFVNNLDDGTNAVLLIEINGQNYSIGDGITKGNGLKFAAGSDGSSVGGIILNEWFHAGIMVDSSDTIAINGNFIGTNSDGDEEYANCRGIFLNNSISTTIGSSANEDRNLIAGSFSDFLLGGAIVVAGGNGNTIQGNLIGTDRTGMVALENSVEGVVLYHTSSATLGGFSPSEKNVISGQTINGVSVLSSNASIIAGNFIGTDVTGTSAIGNKNAGIGLSATGEPTFEIIITDNVISGNGKGIVLGSLFFNFGTFENLIYENFIGTDVSGTRSLSNETQGIWVIDSYNEILANLISGNGKNGILITSSASNNIVVGNYIGTDITGKSPLGNHQNGIQLGTAGGLNGALSNVIADNLISGNKLNGIKIQSFSSGNVMQANLIGVDPRENPLPNGKNGIEIVASSNNLIGGDAKRYGNVIAYNKVGVSVGANSQDTDSVFNAIVTNSIFANTKKGIDLHEKQDDEDESTDGPNHFQPSPVIESAKTYTTSITVKGKLESSPDQNYLIQIFGNPAQDAKQGKSFIGEVTVTTNGNGFAEFNGDFELRGRFDDVTATSTLVGERRDEFLETSQFSRPKKVKIGNIDRV